MERTDCPIIDSPDMVGEDLSTNRDEEMETESAVLALELLDI